MAFFGYLLSVLFFVFTDFECAGDILITQQASSDICMSRKNTAVLIYFKFDYIAWPLIYFDRLLYMPRELLIQCYCEALAVYLGFTDVIGSFGT